MADEQPPAAPASPAEGKPSAPEAKKGGSSKLLLPIVVSVATLLGAGVGVLVVAPKLIASREAHAAESAAESETEGKGAEAKKGEKGPLFKIDNLIVNPAGSQGSRFLMISVAIETRDGKMDEELRRQEPRIRDVLIALLEKHSMESLGRPGIRDSLKEQIADTVSILAGSKERLHVFLPQFVIQ
jgi:flagellar FliL protein